MVWEIFLLVIILITGSLSIRIIRPFQVGVVERFGKFSRKIESGIHFIIPLVESVKIVDLREHVIDVPAQEVICKDNVVVVVDAVVYYQIIDPIKSVYNVSNFLTAIIKLAQTNLRSIIGEMELDETLSGREYINAKLREELDKVTDKWGVKVTRIEIQRIDPPKEIQDAMAKQMKAEREKRAMILLAEGEKASKILKAEGFRDAAIKEAEGRAKAIDLVVEALKKADKRYLVIKYLESLPELAKSSQAIVIPYEASEFIGALKGLKEILKDKKK